MSSEEECACPSPGAASQVRCAALPHTPQSPCAWQQSPVHHPTPLTPPSSCAHHKPHCPPRSSVRPCQGTRTSSHARRTCPHLPNPHPQHQPSTRRCDDHWRLANRQSSKRLAPGVHRHLHHWTCSVGCRPPHALPHAPSASASTPTCRRARWVRSAGAWSASCAAAWSARCGCRSAPTSTGSNHSSPSSRCAAPPTPHCMRHTVGALSTGGMLARTKVFVRRAVRGCRQTVRWLWFDRSGQLKHLKWHPQARSSSAALRHLWGIQSPRQAGSGSGGLGVWSRNVGAG